jgi:hypothetical protein
MPFVMLQIILTFNNFHEMTCTEPKHHGASIESQQESSGPETCGERQQPVFVAGPPDSNGRSDQLTGVTAHDIRIPLLIAIV